MAMWTRGLVLACWASVALSTCPHDDTTYRRWSTWTDKVHVGTWDLFHIVCVFVLFYWCYAYIFFCVNGCGHLVFYIMWLFPDILQMSLLMVVKNYLKFRVVPSLSVSIILIYRKKNINDILIFRHIDKHKHFLLLFKTSLECASEVLLCIRFSYMYLLLHILVKKAW